MEKKDTAVLMDILKAAYPNNFKDMPKEAMRNMMVLYHDIFKEYPVQLVAAALKQYIKDNKYPPTIAGLQEQIDLMVQASESELWSSLEKAMRNGIHHAAEEFAKLPEECRTFLGSPQALKNLAMADADVVNTVTKGQFFRQIKQIRKKKQADYVLPEKKSALLEGDDVE